jgi:hypothetical protein
MPGKGKGRGDAAFLEGVLTDDFVGVGPLGFMLNKQQWLGRFAGGLSYESFAVDELETRFCGDAAVATSRQKQAGEFQCNDVGGEFRATHEIRSVGGQGLPRLRERSSFASTLANQSRTDADHTGGSITKRLMLHRRWSRTTVVTPASPYRSSVRPTEQRYAPTAGSTGSGREKKPRKRATACPSPSIFISPERSAPARARPS